MYANSSMLLATTTLTVAMINFVDILYILSLLLSWIIKLRNKNELDDAIFFFLSAIHRYECMHREVNDTNENVWYRHNITQNRIREKGWGDKEFNEILVNDGQLGWVFGFLDWLGF